MQETWVICLPELWLQSETILSWSALYPPKLEQRRRLLLNRQAELWRCISGFSSLSSTSWDLWRHHPAHKTSSRKVLSQLWPQSHRFNCLALSAQTGWGAICFPSRASSATWWLHTVRGGVSMDKAWVPTYSLDLRVHRETLLLPPAGSTGSDVVSDLSTLWKTEGETGFEEAFFLSSKSTVKSSVR